MSVIVSVSFIAGLATVGGAIIPLCFGGSGGQIMALILGIASGVMLGVVGVDLLPSAWMMGGPVPVAIGLVSGWVFVGLLSRTLDNVNGGTSPSPRNRLVKAGYLVAAGIALHDLPEGIAIAAGYAATPSLGWVIALAIGFHNIPEGMAMAAPMVLGGQPAKKILSTAALVSLVTPLGALLGLLLVGISSHLIAYLLALAGGSMLYIVLRELWPQGRQERASWALGGGILGLLLVFCLSMLE